MKERTTQMLLVIVAVLLGVHLLRTPMVAPAQADATDNVAAVLRARMIELVDDRGQVRANLKLEPDGAAMATFATTAVGDLEVVVDWTLPDNDLDVLLARGECQPEQLIALQCDVGALADGADKPERVGISSAAAGTYTLYVINLGATRESFSFQVLLTTVGTAARRDVRSSAVRVDPGRLFRKGSPGTVIRLPD